MNRDRPFQPDFTSIWCRDHWARYDIYQPNTKKGGMLFTVKLCQAGFMHPRVQAMAKAGTPSENVEAGFRLAGPICCLLGDAYFEALDEWVDQEHCLTPAPDKNSPCHLQKGHEGDHDHFWPKFEVSRRDMQ